MKNNPRHEPLAVLFGTGGHAGVLLEIVREVGGVCLAGVLTKDAAWWGKTWCGLPVLGGNDTLPIALERGITHFILGIGSVGPTTVRHSVFICALASGLIPWTVRHPSCVVAGSARMGDGCHLLARSVINTNARLDRNVIINTGAIVEHDCEIGESSHIASGAVLCGQVVLESRVHIGANATVRQGIRIGTGAVIGAGSVVVQPVPAGVTVVGVPARELNAIRS